MTALPSAETGYPGVVASRLAEIAELCRRFGVRRLDLFGSAATGRFDPAHSDLDFLVEFEEMPPGKHANAYFGLLEGLETLFQRRIDLLTGESVENPYLRRSIEAERRPLFPTP